MNDEDESQNVDAEPRSKSSLSAWSVVIAVLAVSASSTIAFFCTCFPVGYLVYDLGGGVISEDATAEQVARTNQLFIFACIVGGCVAVLVGAITFRLFRTSWNKQ